MSSCSVCFGFRAWVYPECDEAPATIEVWHRELELTTPKKRRLTEWVLDAFCNENLYDLFELDKSKHWQVVGEGVLSGWHDSYSGEYDEELEVTEYKKAEVPAEWFEDPLQLKE